MSDRSNREMRNRSKNDGQNEKTNQTRRNVLRLAGGASASSLAIPAIAAADNSDSKNHSGFVTDNSQTPDWYEIGSSDDLKHKPKDTVANNVSTQESGLCLGGEVKVSGYKVGIDVCHYGGCNFEVSACYVACATGTIDDCDAEVGVSIGDSTSPISGEIVGSVDSLDPLVFLVEGEICHYDPTSGSGRTCKDTEIYFNFDEEVVN
ncbi:hypothetical protein [Natrinema altunense]|uniref:hypothetical protein n=1 Tax=Natrinema altunense TaxID=222984 RepID=UPI000AF44AB4|nr:hypothetical protein [Natrinema altunense]